MQRRTDRIATLVLAAMLAVGLGGGAQGARGGQMPTDAIVARVNGQAILLSQLKEAAVDQSVSPQALMSGGLGSEGFRRVLTQYVDETLLVQKAQREEVPYNPVQTAAAVDGQIQTLQRNLGSEANLNDFLEHNHLTMDSLRRVLTERERRRTLSTEVVAMRVNVDSETLRVFVESRRAAGEMIEQVRLAQIMIRCPEAQQGSEYGQRLRLQALQAAREAGKDPDSFGKVVAAYSDDPAGRARGGGLGWLDPEQLRPELQSAVRGMRPGDVSAPITTSEGYHVLLLIDRRPPRALCYAEEFAAERVKLIEQLRSQASIQMFDLQGRVLPRPAVRDAEPGAGEGSGVDDAPLKPVLPTGIQ